MSKASASQNGVSIITCTNRPRFFESIVNNYKRQLYPRKELIIILNKDGMKLADYRRKVRFHKHISVYKAPERYSLGRCLNMAVGKAKYPVIAKFDDDDYYSPYYLREQTKALRRTGAGIVGKGAHLKYFEAKKILAVTSPKQRHKFVHSVAGGTLLFKKKVYRRIRFANLTLGEDTNFMRRIRARGFKIYATSPYNFVGIRRKNKGSHTWKATDGRILRGSRIVARTAKYRRYAIRPLK